MDNAPTEKAAQLDYTVISNMLREIVDFKWSESHIISDQVLRVILNELEYWHNRAEELQCELREKRCRAL